MSKSDIVGIVNTTSNTIVTLEYAENSTDELLEATQTLPTETDRHHLKAIIGLSDARYGRVSNRLKGFVFVLDGEMPARSIIGSYKDLCGGVSLYKVVGFDTKGVGIDEHIRSSLNKLKNNKNFVDLSIDYSKTDAGYTVSVGKHGCLIGIYKAIVNRKHDEVWFIAVRSYYVEGSELIHSQLRKTNQTISELYESDLYNSVLKLSDGIRDGLAAEFARMLNARLENAVVLSRILESEVPTVKPHSVNHYNVIQMKQFRDGEVNYYFYARSYGFAEEMPSYIAFSRGPCEGFDIIGNGSPMSAGSMSAGYGFPMGVPTSNIGSAYYGLEMDVEQTTDVVKWGGRLLNPKKIVPHRYRSEYPESLKGKHRMYELGYQKDTQVLRAVPKGVYISSPHEHKLKISEILEYEGDNKTIDILKTHPFISNYLISGYIKLRDADPSTKLYNDILIGEDDIMMKFNSRRLRQVVDLIISDLESTANAMKEEGTD